MTRFYTSRRHLMGLGLGGLGAAALGFPLRAATSARLQLSWLHSVQFAGSYLAQDRGYWEALGLDVSLDSGGPNAPVEPPVVSGSALVGISAADYTASAVAQGADFRILGVQMQQNPFAIASLPGNPVHEPADMLGKRLGLTTANRPVLEALCTINDIDPDGITQVPIQYDAAPLIAGEVDCLLCWATDLPVAMAMRDIDSVTMLMADFGYRLQSQTYIANRETVAERRGDIVNLLRGELRGWADFRADPDAAADHTVARFPDAGLDPATQREQARRQAPLMVSEITDDHGFAWFTDDNVAANIETLALMGHAASSDLWDRSLLEEAHAG